jgi:hypothetical protein
MQAEMNIMGWLSFRPFIVTALLVLVLPWGGHVAAKDTVQSLIGQIKEVQANDDASEGDLQAAMDIMKRIVDEFPASDAAVSIFLMEEYEGVDFSSFGERIALLNKSSEALSGNDTAAASVDQKAACLARTFTATSTSELRLKLLIGEGGVIEGLPELIAPGNPTSQERGDYLSLVTALDDCAPFVNFSFGGEFAVTTSSGGGVAFVSLIDDQTSETTENDLELTRDTRREIQRRLTLIGYDTKGVDGSLGKNSRKAIIEWQIASELLPTGYLNDSQLSALKRASAEEFDDWEKREASKPRRKKRRVKLCKRGILGILYDCKYEWR